MWKSEQQRVVNEITSRGVPNDLVYCIFKRNYDYRICTHCNSKRCTRKLYEIGVERCISHACGGVMEKITGKELKEADVATKEYIKEMSIKEFNVFWMQPNTDIKWEIKR